MATQEVESSDELDSAAQPLPPDDDELAEPQEDAKRRRKDGDGLMDVDSLMLTPGVVESASQAVEAIDVAQIRTLCRPAPDDLHELVAERSAKSS